MEERAEELMGRIPGREQSNPNYEQIREPNIMKEQMPPMPVSIPMPMQIPIPTAPPISQEAIMLQNLQMAPNYQPSFGAGGGMGMMGAQNMQNIAAQNIGMNAFEGGKSGKKRRRGKEGERVFKCNHCEKTYLSYPALYTHIKTKHADKQHDHINNGRGRGRPKKPLVYIYIYICIYILYVERER